MKADLLSDCEAVDLASKVVPYHASREAEPCLPPIRIRLVDEEFLGTREALLRLAARAAATLRYHIDSSDCSNGRIQFCARSKLAALAFRPAALQFDEVGAYRFRAVEIMSSRDLKRSSRTTQRVLARMRRLAG